MNEPMFHPVTKQQFEKFLQRPSHAVIITGSEGIGKYFASTWLSIKLLRLDGLIENYPYATIIRPDGQSISIQAMRDLANFTKLKTPKTDKSISRIVIIEQAQQMTIEAQNALLKLLEEPPSGTILILTAPSDQRLLPTIRSRAQIIQIQRPPADTLIAHFESAHYAVSNIKQAQMMSGGLPGLMSALLEQNDDHPLAKASLTARDILKSDTFARLCMVDQMSKQRSELERIIFMVKQMAHAAIAQNAARGSGSSINRWQIIQAAAYAAEAELTVNAQPKLLLTNFMLQI